MTPSLASRLAGLACAVGLSLASWGARADDWPQYRGTSRDGRSAEKISQAWPAGGPKVLWRKALGTGYSGIAVVAGKAYTLFGSGGDEVLAAYEAATGKELWRVRLDRDRNDEMGSGPRSTPTVDGDLVFALGASGKLYAVDAKTGAQKWRKDLVTEFEARVPQWGISTVPIVEGDLLLVDVGGRRNCSLVAFEKATGKVRWTVETDKPGYSTPIALTFEGVRQALFFTGSSLVSVAPATGQVYWRVPWETSYDVNAAAPVFIAPDKVFISSSYDKGAQVLRMKKEGAGVAVEQLWRSRVMKNHFNSSVLVDGVLYGFDDATLKAIDAVTGEERWKARGYGKGSLLWADGHLLVLSDQGELGLVEATPQAFREKVRVAVVKGKTWTMPTLAEGRLYVRTEAELVVLDLKA